MKNKIGLFAVLFFLVVIKCFAQNTGEINGKIVEKISKQPLPGVNIIVIGTNLGSSSDENGNYRIKNVPEGIYKLKVSYIGFNTYIEPDVRVVREKSYYVNEIELIPLPIESQEVTITSGYFDYRKDMPVSGYSYTREEIVRSPGAAGDIFRALETLPGVSTSGGEFSAFSVRGDTPDDNLILIDNIPFNRITHFSEIDGDMELQGGRFSIFSQGLIEKADFQSGGFSSKYGTKRASLLNLNVKEGNKVSPNFKGSYDLMGWEANYDGPVFIHPNTSVLLSARNIDFSTILKMIGDEGDGTSKFGDYIIKTTTDFNKSNKFSILGIYTTESHFRDSYHYFKGEDNYELEISDQKENKTLLGANWRLLTGHKGFLNTSIYFSRIEQIEKAGEINIDPVYNRKPEKNEISEKYPLYLYDIDERQFGAKTDFTYNLIKIYTLNAGVSIQQISSDTRLTLTEQDTVYIFNYGELTGTDKFLVVTPEFFNNNFNKGRMEYAGYIEASFSPSTRFDLNTGFRYEYDDFSKKNYISPRLSGSYKLNSSTSLNFSGGIYYQPPLIRKISFDAGNANLKNEKAYHYILGLSHYLNDALKLSIEGYYKKLEDLIVQPNSNNNSAFNSGKGYAYGMDLSLIRRFVDNFYGQVNYSYSQCKVKDFDKDKYHFSDFNQPHMFNILFGYQFNDNWSVSAKWKYATGKPKDEYIIFENVLNNINRMRYSKEITSENSQRYSDFHSLNLRVDYRHQFTNWFAISAYIDIMNLYDRENQTGENFQIITGENSYSSFPMLPTFGFKLEI